MITSLSEVKVLAPFFQPIRSETKTNRGSRVHIFPRFVSAMCNYFRVLIGLPDCLSPFLLAEVITLVLVLQHSIETCSNTIIIILSNYYYCYSTRCTVQTCKPLH